MKVIMQKINYQGISLSRLILLILISSVALVSCNTSKRTQGALAGATIGAATGAILGKNNRAVAAIIGASIGGVAGALIGGYMDAQAEEIGENLEGATVERIGEGIVVSFDSGLLFDFDSYSLKPETKQNLDKLANTLEKYDKTDVMVLGHTDNKGPSEYNLRLSEKRAENVKNYLKINNISSRRLKPIGLGETDPLVDNNTEENRQKNRRVEITIVANKKLIRDAKRSKVPGA